MRQTILLLGTLIGVTACASRMATPAPTRTAPDAPQVAMYVDTLLEDFEVLEADGAPPAVVVRTFKGSPYVNVLAWAGDEARFGLRSSLRADGEISRGFHSLFMGAETVRQLMMRNGGDWSIFPLGSTQGRPFVVSGWFRDVHSCEGDRGCTPFDVMTSPIEDHLLRRSATRGLEVRVWGRTANMRTVVTLSPAVVSAYLATFDSIVTTRRAASAR